ncbi:hypothetical protein [Psychrobacter sp.]
MSTSKSAAIKSRMSKKNKCTGFGDCHHIADDGSVNERPGWKSQ